ncbi:hypothetical protein RUM44_007093 [Polyplax serrata]|uniref:Uncharacterized protein n=1 Tax=Polyplax serrata TaxID=468196 RepID=A0ABR1AZS4_POLSC
MRENTVGLKEMIKPKRLREKGEFYDPDRNKDSLSAEGDSDRIAGMKRSSVNKSCPISYAVSNWKEHGSPKGEKPVIKCKSLKKKYPSG